MTDLVLERFWDKVKVDPITKCWNWLSSLKSGSYGQFQLQNKSVYAHRFAYEVNKGKIPEGLELDHLCRNRACCNPNHLEPVTRRINLLRGNTFQAREAKQTYCKRGHLLEESNLDKYQLKKGHRCCLICLRSLQRKHNLTLKRRDYKKKYNEDYNK